MSWYGDAIRQEREKQGLTRYKLALISNVGNSIIYGTEDGSRRMTVETLGRVLDTLGLKLEIVDAK